MSGTIELGGNIMRKFLLSTVGLIALGAAAPASAADMAVKAPPPPVVAPIYNWTGFYIGANGGWAPGRNFLGFILVGDFPSGRPGPSRGCPPAAPPLPSAHCPLVFPPSCPWSYVASH